MEAFRTKVCIPTVFGCLPAPGVGALHDARQIFHVFEVMA